MLRSTINNSKKRIGVLIDNKLSTNKITKDYVSLIDIVEINEDGVKMVPSM